MKLILYGHTKFKDDSVPLTGLFKNPASIIQSTNAGVKR